MIFISGACNHHQHYCIDPEVLHSGPAPLPFRFCSQYAVIKFMHQSICVTFPLMFSASHRVVFLFLCQGWIVGCVSEEFTCLLITCALSFLNDRLFYFFKRRHPWKGKTTRFKFPSFCVCKSAKDLLEWKRATSTKTHVSVFIMTQQHTKHPQIWRATKHSRCELITAVCKGKHHNYCATVFYYTIIVLVLFIDVFVF